MRKCAQYRAKAMAHARLAMLSRSEALCERYVRIAASFLTRANQEAMRDLRAHRRLKVGADVSVAARGHCVTESDDMSEIMTRCPVTGEAVSTGLTTHSVIFESIPDVDTPMNCPVCGRQHFWSQRSAWVKGLCDRSADRRTH
jgi:hypothetical protein